MYVPFDNNELVNTNNGAGWDITDFIYEQSDYNNLSSYDGVAGTSKSFALYYTQGQKNIKGLFFKPENPISPIFENYAIRNIIKSVTGRDFNPVDKQEYMRLSFRITYQPIDNERITTNKAYIIGGLPRTINYNQNANFIETRFYGENLKGVIARIGNVEKTLTYRLAFLSDVPKAGTLFDEHYYISTVAVEYLPTHIKCTIGLSKDFNRLSQYVGVSSFKRMWEISERQIVNRETAINEYVVISDKNEQNTSNAIDKSVLKSVFNAIPSQYIPDRLSGQWEWQENIGIYVPYDNEFETEIDFISDGIRFKKIKFV